MNKVKIKCLQGKRPDRGKFLTTLSIHNVKCFKLQDISGDSYLVWCNSDTDIDLLFSNQCVETLRQINCEPQLPLEVKARRTVILRQVDESIIERSGNDIVAELQRCNSWLTLVDIYVFPKSPVVKLVCSTNEKATKILSSGVRMFNLSIPPVNIVQEEFVNLITCYRCYAVEDHQASSCTKPQEIKVCSVCAMAGHT